MPTRVMNKSGVDEIHSGDRRFFVGKKVAFEDVIRGEERLVKNSCIKSISCSEESSSIGKNSDLSENSLEKSGDGDEVHVIRGEEGLVKNSCIKSISCSEESSSIGKNSDLSENSLEKSGDGDEVQSSYKGPLDAMEALEEVLPIRRGISRFYNGKSNSFASLADASSSSSMKDLAKPQNAYMRKRRNLLAFNLNWDKPRSSPLRGNGGGISKRVTNSSRTTLALAVAMSNSENEKQAVECNSPRSSSLTVSTPRKDFSSWRSFSLADLQQCVSVGVTCSNSNEVATKPC